MSYRDDYRVDIPEGESGDWSIRRIVVSEEEAKFDRLRAVISFSGGGRGVPAGTYTGLYHGNSVVMSDTPHEIRDHFGFILRAKGRVLIHGLGLGMCLAAVLKKDEVTSVTVIEKSPDVIKLVGPSMVALAKERIASGISSVGREATVMRSENEVGEITSLRVSASDGKLSIASTTFLTIRLGDCFTWKPEKGARWDVVWHDVWDNICTDNLPEMTKLHRRFGRRCDWQGSWCRDRLLSERRREKRSGW